MSTKALCKHRVYCLHGNVGQITADVAATDTTFTVDQATIDDVVIIVGEKIKLEDGTNKTVPLTITAIDSVAKTITVDTQAGFAFLAATPTTVRRPARDVFKWKEDETILAACPENAAHPILGGTAKIVERQAPGKVEIVQTAYTGTHSVIDAYTLDPDANTTGTINASWPFNITISSVKGFFVQTKTGDVFSANVNPDYPAGNPTAAVSPAQTTLTVDPAVLAYANVAYRIKLKEGATEDDLGRIVSIDLATQTIYVETATVNSFTTAANVLLTVEIARSLPMPNFQSKVTIGLDTLQGTVIPRGAVLSLSYTNNDSVTKARGEVWITYSPDPDSPPPS